MTIKYKCDICGRTYDTEEKANACEKRETPLQVVVPRSACNPRSITHDSDGNPQYVDVTFSNGETVAYMSVCGFADYLTRH